MLVKPQVTVIQARRADESAICTVVGYGCHSVTLGPDTLFYSADYPGAMRDVIRSWTGGEAVFLQAAGGNALPRVAFTDTEDEAVRVGRALALEALHAVEARAAWPRRIVRSHGSSEMNYSLYRFEPADEEAPPVLAAAEERCTLPLGTPPTAAEITAQRQELEERLEAVRAAGGDEGELNRIRFHLKWARALEPRILAGEDVAATTSGPVHAFRIGDGAIVTGPGEVFAEIGMAVKERSPAAVTLYCGYSNGAIGYLPTAAGDRRGRVRVGTRVPRLRPRGELRPGLPAAARRDGSPPRLEPLPEREAPAVEGWVASGRLPPPLEPPRYERPPL